ncbi:hypothetical protein J6G99_02130 [bacterium]|nr:hypothetical protein [bacterium]
MIVNSIQSKNIYTTQEYKKLKPQNINFTGFSPAPLLNWLDTNQAWGANAVDFFCMVLPRTLTDFGRGKDAGIETARRESMGTINDSSVGAYGTLAGLALAMGVNKSFKLGDRDIKVSSVFADSETIDMMGDIWYKKLSPDIKDPLLERIKLSLGNYEVFKDGKWEKFTDSDIEKASKILKREIETHEKLSKDIAYDVRKILASSNNLENNFRIISKTGKEHSSRYGINSIVENTFKLSKLFTKEKVVEAFENSIDSNSNEFLKALKKMNLKRSLSGVAIATAVGCSVQPINMWLTKRKTGSDSFVGGGKKDDSLKFKIEKALVGFGFGAGVIATIGNPKNLIKNLQFKGFTPTINQLKFIYGATIISRFLVARNENELKESSIKDMLGFTNWLILGNFVQKLTAQALDKSLVKQEKFGGIINWITSSSLKTRDEILHSELGEKAFKNGKALSFNEMVKALPKGSEAFKKLKVLTIAQLAGYAYSGIVLGIGIPKLNIFLTNRRLAKEHANQKIQDANEQQKEVNNDGMLNPSNIQFLKEFTGSKFFNKN